MTGLPVEGESGRILVLANQRLSRRIASFQEILAGQMGDRASIEQIDGPAAMAERARRALAEGYRRIAVAGGDGTVGVVVRALLGEPVEIGILPIGTFNNFARSLGLPLQLLDAARVLVEGEPRAVDLGRVVSRHPATTFVFKEAVGVGIDAAAFATGPDVPGPSKIPHGIWATLKTLLFFRPKPVKFNCDDDRGWIRCTQLLVANASHYAAAFQILPEARPDDGVFHVLARRWRGRFNLLLELPAILTGRHCRLEHDVTRTCRKVRVAGHSSVLLHADGEFFCRMPATVEILEGAVTVIVPRS